MSCTDLLSSYTAVSTKPTAQEKEALAAEAGLIAESGGAEDIEDNSWSGKYLGTQKKGGWQRYGTISARISALSKYLCGVGGAGSSTGSLFCRCIHATTVFTALVLILVFIYAAFTV